MVSKLLRKTTENKFYKKILVSIIVSFAVGYIVFSVPWIVHIDKTVTGIDFYQNGNLIDNCVNVTIRGQYKKYIFKSNIFSGEIIISSVPYTQSSIMLDVEFNKKGDGAGALWYVAGGIMESMVIREKGNFDQLMISIDGRIITAPAQNMEDGWTVYNSFLQNP